MASQAIGSFQTVPSAHPDQDQDLAYERAVIEGRRDPSLKNAIESAFLEEDSLRALARFGKSEHAARMLRLLGDANVVPGSRVLDFGGGRGLVAGTLSLEGFQTTLCEPNRSPVCGTGAAEAMRSAGELDFEISAGKVEDLDDDAFDAVVCRAVLHHLEPLVPILREVRRVIRPGGALICSDEPTIRRARDLEVLQRENVFVQYGVEETALRKSDYVQALQEAGFKDIRVKFPVSWRDYRDRVRPETNTVIASALYLRYRARSSLRPTPGEVRSIVARNPS